MQLVDYLCGFAVVFGLLFGMFWVLVVWVIYVWCLIVVFGECLVFGCLWFRQLLFLFGLVVTGFGWYGMCCQLWLFMFVLGDWVACLRWLVAGNLLICYFWCCYLVVCLELDVLFVI